MTVNDPEYQAMAAQNNLLLSFRDGEAFANTIATVLVSLQAIWDEKPWIE
jgi:hypothetical protein